MFHFPFFSRGFPMPMPMPRVAAMVELFECSKVNTVEKLLPFVGSEVSVRDLQQVVLYVRKPRWQALAAETLIALPDVEDYPLEAVVTWGPSDSAGRAWMLVSTRESTPLDALERMAWQSKHTSLRRLAAAELRRRLTQ